MLLKDRANEGARECERLEEKDWGEEGEKRGEGSKVGSRERERIMGETRVGEKHGGFTAPLARSEFIARVISIHKR